MKINLNKYKSFATRTHFLSRVIYAVSSLAVIALFLIILLRLFLFREINWLGKIDIILTFFILLDLLILISILNQPKLKLEKTWFWILIILLFFNTIWEVAEKGYSSIGVYEFDVHIYYIIIFIGLILLKFVRQHIYKYFILIKKVVRNIDIENNQEKIAELTRQNKFSQKYKLTNKIPLVRNVARYFYKQGKYYSLGIIIAVVLLVALSIPLFGRFLNDDEFHLFNVAKGLIETKQCVAWNFLYDAPGYLYSNNCSVSSIISIFFIIFGTSLVSAKMPFLILSVINIFLLYSLGKKLINKFVAIALILFYSTNPFFAYHAGYIRVYALLITITLLILILILKLFEQYRKAKYKKNIIEMAVISLLLYFGYKLRITFLPLISGTLLLMLIKTINFIKYRKIRKYLYYFIPICSLLIVLLIDHNKYIFGSFYKLSGRFNWHTFNISLLNISPQFTIIIFLILAIICFSALYKEYANKNKTYISHLSIINITYLFIILLFINISYGFFVNQYNMIPRYAIYLVLLNVIIIIPAIFLILSPLIKKRLVYSIIMIVILSVNASLWLSDKINDNLANKYNYIDMYALSSSTSSTRLKEQYKLMYDIILENIKPEDKRIALVTALFNDPQLISLREYKDKIDLIGIGDYSIGYEFDDIDYEYPYKKIDVKPSNYELEDNGQRHPIRKQVLHNYKKEYDKIFITWPSRKTYKHAYVMQYAEELGFTRISGKGIDQSNIEIYFYEKR